MKLKETEIKVVVLLLAICLISYFTSYLSRDSFLYYTREDGVFEYLTAVFFLITSVCFLMLFISRDRFRNEEDKSFYVSKKNRYFFLIMAFVFFFGAGEEISWGQRLIGFDTPDGIEKLNVQEEFNIHNLELFNIKSKDGVRKTGLGKLFTMKQLFLGSFLVYLLIVPLLNSRLSIVRNLLQKMYVPIPPVWLGVVFILNLVNSFQINVCLLNRYFIFPFCILFKFKSSFV